MSGVGDVGEGDSGSQGPGGKRILTYKEKHSQGCMPLPPKPGMLRISCPSKHQRMLCVDEGGQDSQCGQG